MLIISPRIYNDNMRVSFTPHNKIDTVTLLPISNLLTDEAEIIAQAEFNSTLVDGVNLELPVSSDVLPTHWRYMRNDYQRLFETVNYAKARVECIMGSGTQIITTDKLISDTPIVSIDLVGKSIEVARGGNEYVKYPSIEDLMSKSYNVLEWIEQNKTNEYSYLLGNYADESISMNPWVRKIVPAKIDSLTSINLPTFNDILTSWNDPSLTGRTWATVDGWNEYSSFGSDAPKVQMFPANAQGSSIESVISTAISLRNLSLPIECNVRKLSDYQYEVSWSAPVKFAYVAASQTRGLLGNKYDLDNYAFADIISNVIITLSGRSYSTEVVSKSYSLDNNGNLTTEVSNEFPIKIDAGEALTLGTFTDLTNEVWIRKLSRDILRKYCKGKYTVTCDVNASWAIQNNIAPGVKVQIQYPDGSFIKRNNQIIIFVVKNIEKVYEANKFIYALKLIEE